jgi:hypothetical protein
MENKLKHPGAWIKKVYDLGRFSRGGYWTCCGEQEQIAFPCNEAMRQDWRQRQIRADSMHAAKVVKRAMVSFTRLPCCHSIKPSLLGCYFLLEVA